MARLWRQFHLLHTTLSPSNLCLQTTWHLMLYLGSVDGSPVARWEPTSNQTNSLQVCLVVDSSKIGFWNHSVLREWTDSHEMVNWLPFAGESASSVFHEFLINIGALKVPRKGKGLGEEDILDIICLSWMFSGIHWKSWENNVVFFTSIHTIFELFQCECQQTSVECFLCVRSSFKGSIAKSYIFFWQKVQVKLKLD